MNKPLPCIICDLDGTISDPTHRQHFLDKEPRDWDGFFKACVDDPVHEHVRQLLRMIRTHGTYIMILSGRSHAVHNLTVNWLIQKKVPYYSLTMRKEKDHRDDTIIKREMLLQLRSDGYEPIFAIDDRPSVIQMWKSEGIPVLAVNGEGWSEQAAEVRARTICDVAEYMKKSYSNEIAAQIVRDMK
jgi:hypothetical protein